jgi:ferritin-like metal-binding protein YciE
MTHLKADLMRTLRDACAMERHAEWLLRTHVAATARYPEVSARIDADLTATLANQKALAGCMERIEGTDGSDATLAALPADVAGADGFQALRDCVLHLADCCRRSERLL